MPSQLCLKEKGRGLATGMRGVRGESQGTNAAIRCWTRQGTAFSLELLKGMQPYQHLDFRGLASRNVIQYFCESSHLEEKL